MANLKNNKDKSDKSIEKRVEEAVDKVAEKISDKVSDAEKLAKEVGEQAIKDASHYSWWAKLLLYLFYIGLGLILLFLIAINSPAVKDYVATKALVTLNKDLGIDISKEQVSLNIFGDVTISGLKVKDERGNDLITAKELHAESDWFSLLKSTNDLHFQGMTLVNPDVQVVTYKGDSISNFIRFIDKFDDGKPRDPNKPAFHLDARIRIENGKVSIVNQNIPGEEGHWMDAEDVYLNAPRLAVNGPNISARINNFTFKTKRWGKTHNVETFSTDFYLSPRILRLGNLTMNTDRSLLMGDLVFRLDTETGWSDFSNKVFWDMNIRKGSVVSGYDISYFVTDWDNHSGIDVSGNMQGPLNDFTLKSFMAGSPEVHLYTPEAKIQHILEPQFSITTHQLSTDFTYKELRDLFPHFISDKMGDFADVFQRIKFDGNASVNPQKVEAQGKLLTTIGQADIHSFTLTEISSSDPHYVADAYVKDLNTTAFTENKVVGLLSGQIQVQGQGFDLNTLSLTTKSQIDELEIMGKSIHNILVDGSLNQKKFDGIIDSEDFQLMAKMEGLVDFSTSRIMADAKLDIQSMNLNYFGYTASSDAYLSGIIDGKFAMTDLNDLDLDVNMENVKLASADQNFDLPTGSLKSYLENRNRIINVDAPGVVEGSLAGKYNLSDLGEMVISGLQNILAGYHPPKIYSGQNFDFEFNVHQNLISYFLPEVRIPNDGHVKGSYVGNTNDLVLNVNADQLFYLQTQKQKFSEEDKLLAQINPEYTLPEAPQVVDSIEAKNLDLRINTALPFQQIELRTEQITLSNTDIKDLFVVGNKQSDKLHITTTFKTANALQEEDVEENEYAINFNQSTDENEDLVFQFEPTTIKVKDDIWAVDTSNPMAGTIIYHKKESDLNIHDLRFYSEESSVSIEGDFKSSTDFDAKISLEKLQLEKLRAFFSGDNMPDLEGVANGTAEIVMNQEILQPIVDVRIDDIKMNGEEVGNLKLIAENSDRANVFDVSAILNSQKIFGDNILQLSGTIDNNTPSPTLDLNTEFNDFDVAFAGSFVEEIFSNFRGKATGNIEIKGPLDNIDYSGALSMEDFGFKFNFNGVDYNFKNAEIPISKGLVMLNNLVVNDGRRNSKGSISGAIQFQDLSNIGLNLLVRADDLLLLNTTQKDLDTFWGRVTAQGDIYVSGPVEELSIDADAQVLGGSEFTLNTNTTSSVEEFKMLRFLEVDENTGEISVAQKENTGLNMNVSLSLDVDENSTVNVLVGDDLGDISVQGTAKDLQFNMNRAGVMTMNGEYRVGSGTFISKAILERTFQIEKGSNIAWDGDVMNPDLDIVADYYRVVSNIGEYLGVGRLQPTQVQLQIAIQGKMQNINPVMEIKIPEASSQIREALAVKVNTEDEKVKQIGSILVMNSFNTSTSMADINFENTALSTGYSVLFKNLAAVFNTISNDFQIDLDYIQGDQAANTADRANTSLNLSVSPRIKIKTGIGIPLATSLDAQNNYLSGEGQIEYDVSSQNDGSLILRAYSKPANIGLVVGSNANENQSYGVGVVYSRSFNSFGDLFGKKKKKEENEKEKINNQSSISKEDSIK